MSISINFYQDGNHSEYICDCCGDTFRTAEKRDDHINKGCYADKTGQYKLDNKNHFFNSYSCCSRNPFIEYGDIETDMEKLGPDDDWDSEHIPRAIELHAVTKYKHLYEMFDIPLHYKAKGSETVIKQLIEEYLLKFYENKLLTEEQCKPLCDYAPKNRRISFEQYARRAKYKCSLTKEEQEEKKHAKNVMLAVILLMIRFGKMLMTKMIHTRRFQSALLS